jgi:hypothetical protein
MASSGIKIDIVHSGTRSLFCLMFVVDIIKVNFLSVSIVNFWLRSLGILYNWMTIKIIVRRILLSAICSAGIRNWISTHLKQFQKNIDSLNTNPFGTRKYYVSACKIWGRFNVSIETTLPYWNFVFTYIQRTLIFVHFDFHPSVFFFSSNEACLLGRRQ